MSLRWEIHIPFANHRTLVPLNRICPHFMQFHYFLMNFIEICVFLHAGLLSNQGGIFRLGSMFKVLLVHMLLCHTSEFLILIV